MPLSDHSHRPWVLRELEKAAGDLTRIRSAVDAGAGYGAWKEFCGPWIGDKCRWTAVEIWQPYISRFLLPYRYTATLNADLRDLDPFPAADVVFLGDVLEHMDAADAVQVWDRARKAAWRLVLGIPVVPYPQGEAEGNPYEAHVATWSVDAVLASFKGIYAHTANAVTGAFIAEGEADGPA
jgi:SAM-dependent methyltransferase